MRDLLKSEYPEVWKWFSSVKAKSQYNDSVEPELLSQKILTEQTKQLLLHYLQPSWLRTDAIITAESIGVYDELEIQLNKKLKMLKKEISRIQKNAVEIVKAAELEAESSQHA